MKYDDCEMRNSDGVKPIYQQREQLNKLALQNLETGMKGKLGELSNLQVFNFSVTDLATGSEKVLFEEYNTTETTGNITDCVTFGVDGVTNKGLYYNLLSVTANVNLGSGANSNLLSDSYVQFYLTENLETSTTSLGRKIPRKTPIHGTDSGTITWTTNGAKQGYQYISTDLNSDSVTFPTNHLGLRCSGLALKTISLQFLSDETMDNIVVDFTVYVDVSSVSSSY